jgi:hypothetical protein
VRTTRGPADRQIGAAGRFAFITGRFAFTIGRGTVSARWEVG